MTSEPEKDIALEQKGLEHQITFCKRVAWSLVVGGVLAAGWGISSFWGKDKLGDLGSYLQGATGSLFALAGLMFIYVAFLGQKQQLIIQNEQFKAQKKQSDEERERQSQLLLRQQKEIEAQQEQFEAQQDSINRQNFESSFFQLLTVHNQIVSGMMDFDLTTNQRTFEGRGCFEKWYKSFKTTEYIRGEGEAAGMVIKSDAVKKYERFYWDYQGLFGHYFRNLYHVIKFVNESELLKDNDPDIEYKRRRLYTSLVRATLSQYELAFLFYNCLSPFGEEKFKPLVEKFGLLKNFSRESLLNPEDEKLYGEKAFK